jgi:hypothetical protein
MVLSHHRTEDDRTCVAQHRSVAQPSRTTLDNREEPQDPGILSSRVLGYAFPLMPSIFFSIVQQNTR